MRNLFFFSCLILFLGCNLNVPKKEISSDIEFMFKKNSLLDLNNKKIDLISLKGKKVVINYWATWCRPCIVEMPGLERAQFFLNDYNYTFLLVSDENTEKISKFKLDNKYNFNFVKSVGSNDVNGIYSLPTTFVFDENGKKVETIVGTIDWDSEEIINKLKTL